MPATTTPVTRDEELERQTQPTARPVAAPQVARLTMPAPPTAAAGLSAELVRVLQQSVGNQAVLQQLQAMGGAAAEAFAPGGWVADLVDRTAGFFGGDTTTTPERPPADGTTSAPAEGPAETPAPKDPAGGGAAPATGGDELAALMAKDRLTPEEVDRARDLIAALPSEAERGPLFLALQTKVAYRSQRDNESKENGSEIGDRMCNLTSLAMCLEYLGVPNPYPELQFEDALERIRVEKVGKPRTKLEGWGGVAEHLGVKVEMVYPTGPNGKKWWLDTAAPHLSGGKASMLSINGHICRLQAVTEEGLVVDDPFGASKLLGGTSSGNYKFEESNKKDDATSNAGEDHVWPWADVEKHFIPWIAFFSVGG